MRADDLADPAGWPGLLARIEAQVGSRPKSQRQTMLLDRLRSLCMPTERERTDESWQSILTAVDDLLYPSFVLGADGAVAAILTAVPTLCVALFDAVQRGDHTAALQIHNRLVPVWMALSGPNLPARVKAALKLQGRHGGRSRRPMSVPSGEDVSMIQEALERVELVTVA